MPAMCGMRWKCLLFLAALRRAKGNPGVPGMEKRVPRPREHSEASHEVLGRVENVREQEEKNGRPQKESSKSPSLHDAGRTPCTVSGTVRERWLFVLISKWL